MALKMYDITTDSMREPTQDDINEMIHARRVMGKLVRVFRREHAANIESGPDFLDRLEAALDAHMKAKDIE